MRGDRGRGPGGIRRGGRGGGRGGRGRRLRGIPGLTKLIIRQLPPRLREEAFYEAAKPFGIDKARWKMFVPGEEPVRQTAPSKPSYAYVAFSYLSDAVKFKEGFDGHRFANGRTGLECFAVVERAPFQVVPRPARKKLLANDNAIESDSAYLAFLAEYEEEQKSEKARGNVSLGQTAALFANGSEATEANGSADVKKRKKAVIVTPLIENVRAKRRERDARKTSSVANGAKNSKKKNIKEPKVVTRFRPVHTSKPKSKRPNTILKRDRYSTATPSPAPRAPRAPSASKTVAPRAITPRTPAPLRSTSSTNVNSKKKMTRTEKRKLKLRQEQQQRMNNKHRAKTTGKSSVIPSKGSPGTTVNGSPVTLRMHAKSSAVPEFLKSTSDVKKIINMGATLSNETRVKECEKT